MSEEDRPINDRILGLKEVASITSLSRSSIKRMEDRGEFPKRFLLSKRRVAWLYSDINNWVNSLTHNGGKNE